MARSALKLTGADNVRKILRKARQRAQKAMRDATGEALIFLERKAQENLDAGIYHKARDPYDPPLTYELYRAFVHTVASTGTGGVRGELLNTSDIGPFIEFGTDDEGTGEHFVPVASGGVLHFIDPRTGADAFSKGHFVHGIHPLHFMKRALEEHHAEVVAIYARHLSAIFN